METQTHQESGFQKVLYNQVTFVIAIIGVAFGVITWVMNPQADSKQDIALINQSIGTIQGSITKIETNHMAHMQKAEEEIARINVEQVAQGKQIVELLQMMKDHIK